MAWEEIVLKRLNLKLVIRIHLSALELAVSIFAKCSPDCKRTPFRRNRCTMAESTNRRRPHSEFQRTFGLGEQAADGKRHQSLASPFVLIRASSPGAKGRGTQGMVIRQLSVVSGQSGKVLGLKPSRSSVVPGGLGISIATFPSVETLGYLLPSREGGLDARGFRLNRCPRPA